MANVPASDDFTSVALGTEGLEASDNPHDLLCELLELTYDQSAYGMPLTDRFISRVADDYNIMYNEIDVAALRAAISEGNWFDKDDNLLIPLTDGTMGLLPRFKGEKKDANDTILQLEKARSLVADVQPVSCNVVKYNKDNIPKINPNGLLRYLEESKVVCSQHDPYIYNGTSYTHLDQFAMRKAQSDAILLADPSCDRVAPKTYENVATIYCDGHSLEDWGIVETRDYTPFEDGLLEMATGKLIPHTPKYFFKGTLRCSWSDAPETCWAEKVIEDIVPDEATRQFIYEAIGYTLFYPRMDPPAVICLYGGGGSGKSTIINMMEAVLGPRLYTTLGFDQVTEKFSIADMEGMFANFCSESSSADTNSTGMDKEILKRISAGEDIDGAIKHVQKKVHFTPTAKLWFCTNDMPNFGKQDGGLLRRLYFVECNAQFPDNPEVSRKVVTDPEMRSWLVHKAYKAYKDWEARGYKFSVSPQMADIKDDYKRENAVFNFLENTVGTGDVAAIKNFLLGQGINPLYEKFYHYCLDVLHRDPRQIPKQNGLTRALKNDYKLETTRNTLTVDGVRTRVICLPEDKDKPMVKTKASQSQFAE